MTKRMYLTLVAVITAVALVAAPAAGAQRHSTTLKATGKLQRWVSPERFSDSLPLTFEIRVNGKAIDSRGTVESDCRYTLFTRRLAVKVNACAKTSGGKLSARSSLAFSYIGSTRFRIIYWVG